MLDSYLSAVARHDATAAPLMVGFRQTENAIVVRPPNGLWKTMTALGAVQRRYLDPVTGQAAFFRIVDEGSDKAVVTVRLKIDDRKISEAEWIVARKGEWGPNGPGCTRVENGTVMTNRPGRNGGPPSGDCAAELTNFNASIVAGRRYPLVDEDAQEMFVRVVIFTL